MIYVQHINAFDRPELEVFQTMSRQVEHREQGIFVAESDKVVKRLLESRFTVISLLLPEKWYHRFEPLLAKRTEDIRVYLMEKEKLETLTGFTFYQGVLGVGKVPDPLSLEQILEATPEPKLFVGVEGITNAENLGGLVRNGVAFGVQALLVDQTACSPFLRRAVRGSMGTIFQIPTLEKLELAETVRRLRGHGVQCIAAHPHTRNQTLGNAKFDRNCCVVFGSEGYGISPALLEACDEAVAIPMAQGVDSLNVGSAAAVFLYEIHRQQHRTGHTTSPDMDSRLVPTNKKRLQS